jgi:hypothetical protein
MAAIFLSVAVMLSPPLCCRYSQAAFLPILTGTGETLIEG